MADPLSISASLVALLQLSQAVIRYVDEVKGGLSDRLKLLVELSGTCCLLETVKDAAERAKWSGAWLPSMQTLAAPNGPLQQFKELLEKLAVKLNPGHGLKKIGKAMSWPFERVEIRESLADLERYKLLFSIAMQRDHLYVSASRIEQAQLIM